MSPIRECHSLYDNYCRQFYGNGKCDPGCNFADCGWDGGDCSDIPEDLADGALIIIVKMARDDFLKIVSTFMRDLGLILRSVIRVKKDDEGQDMVYPWPNDGNSRVKRFISAVIPGRSKRAAKGSKMYVLCGIYMITDIRCKCLLG